MATVSPPHTPEASTPIPVPERFTLIPEPERSTPVPEPERSTPVPERFTPEPELEPEPVVELSTRGRKRKAVDYSVSAQESKKMHESRQASGYWMNGHILSPPRG